MRKGSDEITQVMPSFLDVARRAIRIEHTVPWNHGLRLEEFDFVECLEPLLAGSFVALGKIEMRVVIDAVSRHD
jgi:hypothetical protein